ncbi:ATP-binding cassette domain-containing protein [candidate division KSB3 bacterium]|uniref:ATP-binding cassette domain-containing protein n=1 Tax=candidate division KSB3 bacterium TaxID=2044937 RepID=A0A9D5Q5I2_9BACT|nr:ATP-binding cassette domain-containing protein [candidate division KSB3 bacterium]MBD3324854.1 ATP-binding cassette domain-containing protein [candidate division KSB3 bacterium]
MNGDRTGPAAPLIALRDVTLRVGRTVLFEQTNWEILSDQQWAISGPTGSGKSTLAKALCHEVTIIHGQMLYFFDRPDEATGKPQPRSYFNRGEIVKISPEGHRELLQKYSGYHQARWQSIEGSDVPTVSEFLTGHHIEHICPYDVSPMKVDEEVYRRRRQHAVELLGIEYLVDRKILHISNGEGRKVLIARALMQSPHLLILDDPFCGLDYTSRATLTQAIHDLLAAGSPRILLITPREDEIPADITHVLRVEQNRVTAKGPKATILQNDVAQEVSATSASFQRLPSLDIPPPLYPPPVIEHPYFIEMQDTCVSYGDTQVLHNITWVMRQGEHWAVLGPNGAGKTTLLSLILADNPQAYKNDITLFGRRRGSGESIWEIKQKIGWVSPELQIYYHGATTCHNVICSGFFDSVGLYRTYSPEQAETAIQWMHALDIEPLAERPLGTVSVGQQRLVLLARALVKTPLLLVLDEPCQGLDGKHRDRIITLLDALCQQMAISLIYVTHHFDEMPQAISHVLKLDQGRIREYGTRQEVLGW